MPLKPIDYSKGIQYKIVCNNPAITDCYNGSCISLKDRKRRHKESYTNPNDKGYDLKVYRFIRENGGWDNWVFIQLEESPCKSKQELLARERHWFDLLKPTMNTYSPTFNAEKNKKRYDEYNAEYAATHREENKKRYAEYRAAHKDAISARKKELITCECGCTIRKYELSKHQRTQKHLAIMAQKQ